MKVDGIMSGIQTNYNYNPISKVTEDKNPATEVEAASAKKTSEETQKVASEVYGDVLSKSTDGDTTSAAKQSVDALSDGLVMKKNNVSEITTTLREPAKEEGEKELGSLTGYSSSQLDSLYAQGKISKNDYEKEVERRDELTKQREAEDSLSKDVDNAINNVANSETAGIVNQQLNAELTGISVDAIQAADSEQIKLINQIVNGN